MCERFCLCYIALEENMQYFYLVLMGSDNEMIIYSYAGDE